MTGCKSAADAGRPIASSKSLPIRFRTRTACQWYALRWRAETRLSVRGAVSDFSFFAAEKPRDIGAVHDP